MRTHWLRSRNEYAKTFLITFSSTNLPDALRIPGESPTKAYKYKKPMRCTNCQGYGHTGKNGKKNVAVCGRCANSGYAKEHCLNAVKCDNCGIDHYTESNACRKHQFQKEVIKIQTDELLDRRNSAERAQMVYPNRSYSVAFRCPQTTNLIPDTE